MMAQTSATGTDTLSLLSGLEREGERVKESRELAFPRRMGETGCEVEEGGLRLSGLRGGGDRGWEEDEEVRDWLRAQSIELGSEVEGGEGAEERRVGELKVGLVPELRLWLGGEMAEEGREPKELLGMSICTALGQGDGGDVEKEGGDL